jgi:hypothetical protein
MVDLMSKQYRESIHWIITKMATTAHLEALTILRFFLCVTESAVGGKSC